MVRSEDGTPIRMLGTSQDVTVAKQLDRAKDEFISLVSHQLRTPLTIIRIHGSILEDGIAGALDPSHEKHIRTMTRASVRLIELVDDILSISRVTLNRIRVNAKPADPNKLIATCVEEAIPMAHAKDVKLIFLPDATIGELPLDMVVFGEILRNLIGNAVRYARSKKGQINVTFRKHGEEYILSVSDNGIGIPQMDQAYIFDRFYRANNATVVDSEGSGLGLYIVKLFVEAAGGRIWFESTENVGTTFFVAFPVQGMQPTPIKSV
jgi:Signal transduction histidine kinase